MGGEFADMFGGDGNSSSSSLPNFWGVWGSPSFLKIAWGESPNRRQRIRQVCALGWGFHAIAQVTASY